MSSRTAERNKGVAEAWKREKKLVLEGKGTRDWNEEQQKQIIEKGKAYDENNKAYEAHHMKCVAKYEEYASDVNNMQLLSYDEHHNGAHGGNSHNPTNGYYDPHTKKTTDFGDGPPQPCIIIELSNPVYFRKLDEDRTDNISTEKNAQKKINKKTITKIKKSNIIDKGVKSALNGTKNALVYLARETAKNVVMEVLSEVINGVFFSGGKKNKVIANSSTPDVFDADSKGIDLGKHRRPNDVKAHGQHYHTKKGKIWRDKAPYHRGGK